MHENYYDINKHSYMRYENDLMADYVFSLIDNPNLNSHSTAIELGAGMGRFSPPLLIRYKKVFLVEPQHSYSSYLAKRFEDKAEIASNSAEEFIKNYSGGSAVVYCFHLMHHLSFETRNSIYKFVADTNSVGVLVEPNPINPLFLLQILVTPDMSFNEEKQYLKLGISRYRKEVAAHGLSVLKAKRFLVAPPFLANKFLQHKRKNLLDILESFKSFLPFLCSYELIIYSKSNE